MTVFFIMFGRQIRRKRVFRDKTQVLDTLTEGVLIQRSRFLRHVILRPVEDLKHIQPNCLRSHSILAHKQVNVLFMHSSRSITTNPIHDVPKWNVPDICQTVSSALTVKFMIKVWANIHFLFHKVCIHLIT